MPEVIAFPGGGFRYLKGVFQYSAGVGAESGFEIERARFLRPVSLAEGFAQIEAHLARLGRPTTAFCACDSARPSRSARRASPPSTGEYVRVLEKWGLYRDEINPVARSNVCPEVGAPPAPSFYAFSYTVPATRDRRRDFRSRPAAAKHGRGPGITAIARYGSSTGRRKDCRKRRAGSREIVRRGAAPAGLTWHFARPPVKDLDYEMDVRGVAREIVL